MAEKTTTRFGVDITDLKKGMQEATQIIKLTNSEFKNATAGMDNWSKSADGLSAKVKQLSTIEQQEQKKLEILQEEYRRVVEAQGENSVGARTLATEINNQSAKIKEVQKELKDYTDKLNDLTTETVDTRSNLEKLEDTISDQENQLKNLEREYQNAVITFGENSQEAKNLQQSYNDLSKALEENQNSIVEVLTDEEKLEKAKKELKEKTENLTGSTQGLSDGYTVAKDIIADFIKDGIQWAIDKFKELISAQDEAMKSFQAQTSTSTEDMSAFNDEMQELYKQGYGESLTDIANAMAQVKQTTNETDPSKLNDMTKNAMLLGETYEFDVAESLRAVNMLTDQFGVTSQEAYNLIIQGCQKGLNKNGDLLDVINEYSVHYAQMGNSADEFFNSLLNGTEAGAFSVDKLGDGYKEFGIRTREVNDDVKNAYASLGLITIDNSERVDELTETISDQESKIDDLTYSLEKAKYEQSQFTDETDEFKKKDMARNIAKYESELSELQTSLNDNKNTLKDLQSATSNTSMTYEDFLSMMNAGGEQSKQATQMIFDALDSLDDETQKNTIGVALFGTMWEDSGEKAIQSMFNMTGEINKTNDAMSQIEDLKLSDVNSQLQVLGRTAETEIIMPLINVFLPYIKSGISWISENMQIITDWIQNTLVPILQSAIVWIDNLFPVIQAVFIWIIDNKDTLIATLVAIGTGFLAFNIVTMIQNVIAVFTALATVIQLVGAKQLVTNAIMNANPIGILIALITGLIAYFVHLYNTSDEFRLMLDWLWEKIKEISGNVKDKVKEIWDFFVGFGEYLYDWIHVTIPSKLSELWGNIAEFISDVIGKFTSMKDDIFTAGQNLVEGLWNGIGDKFNWITGKIQEFTGGILDGIKDFFGIHSPSKLFETDIGYNLVYGLANGITKKTSTAVKSMTDLAKATVSPFDNLQANVGIAKNNLSSGLSSSGGNSGSGSTGGGTTLNFYQTNT
ncbi:MAG: phage tail tape measure protein, partial [Oscillospiraceae bacterium]